jgi:hypothetical protein
MDKLSLALVLLHLAGAAGFAVVVSLGLVTAPVRALWSRVFARHPVWSKMLACPMCFGVYAGVAWAAPLAFRARLPWWVVDAHDTLAFAFAVSLLGFASALAEATVGALGAAPFRSRIRRRG